MKEDELEKLIGGLWDKETAKDSKNIPQILGNPKVMPQKIHESFVKKAEEIAGDTKVKTIEVWMEGFMATGQSQGAQKLGEFEADNFDQAVKMYMDLHPGEVDVRNYGYFIWGCKLYDNEADARKSFG